MVSHSLGTDRELKILVPGVPSFANGLKAADRFQHFAPRNLAVPLTRNSTPLQHK